LTCSIGGAGPVLFGNSVSQVNPTLYTVAALPFSNIVGCEILPMRHWDIIVNEAHSNRHSQPAVLWAILTVGLLSSFATMPPILLSHDGAALAFRGDKFSYRLPGRAATSCRFNNKRKLAVCDNGLTSDLVISGLPFEGVVLVEFDGRQFIRPKRP
jgi:hypothetical protein